MNKQPPSLFTEIFWGVLWPGTALFTLLEWASDQIHSWKARQWVEAVAFTVGLLGVAAFAIDLIDRKEERLVRMWNLATDKRAGNSGKIPALEFLNKEGKPLSGIEIPEAFLRGIVLPRADLIGANLSGADLSRADLSRSNLINLDLSGADLSGADLSRSNLTDANLARADLTLANLTGVDLSRANMSGADLWITNVHQSQLDAACLSDITRPPNMPYGLMPPIRQCGSGTRGLN